MHNSAHNPLTSEKGTVIELNIISYGSDARLEFAKKALAGLESDTVNELTLLPIPSTVDGVTVFKSGENLYDLLSRLDEHSVVVGYNLPRGFIDIADEFGIKALELSWDEEFLVENARLTAVGALAKILCSEIKSPAELSIGIIGFGRIGKELSKLLVFLGASLSLFTSKEFAPSELCALGLCGVSVLPYRELTEEENCRKSFDGLDLLINTAPNKIIAGGAAGFENKPRLIELASGDNFPSGIEYERLAALPAKMYPESAGKAIANSLMRFIESPHPRSAPDGNTPKKGNTI